MNRTWHTITATAWIVLVVSLAVAARAGAAISSIQRPPAPAGATNTQPTPRLQYGELLGVSCGSASVCTAVGVFGGGTELTEESMLAPS